MTERKRTTRVAWRDPDDAPELDPGWFDRADRYDGPKLIKRGRPPLAAPKEPVTIRYSRDVLSFFRESGPGWQTRMNDVLAAWVANTGGSATGGSLRTSLGRAKAAARAASHEAHGAVRLAGSAHPTSTAKSRRRRTAG